MAIVATLVMPGAAVSQAGNVTQPPTSGILFSVYPGGSTGELNSNIPVNPAVVLERIRALQSDRPFNLHLYSSWKDVGQDWFWPYYDQQLQHYTAAGLLVTLTIRYSPPPGHDGDVVGYTVFVRQFVRRYAAYPGVIRFVVGNEANAYGSPDASDGPFVGSHEAVVRGIIAARDELDRAGASAQVGFNFAVTSSDADSAFLQELANFGGAPFTSAVAFVGVDVYPGIWPVGSGDVYRDMVDHMRNGRAALVAASYPATVSLDILENGFPTPDEAEQAERLAAMTRAVVENAAQFGVDAYSWFDLWDADSSSPNPFGHYGLLRSDLSPKPAFYRYQQVIAGASTSTVPSSTKLATSLDHSLLGQRVTLTAIVRAARAPTGRVTFRAGGAPIGTSPVNGGRASLVTASLALGTHVLTASYDGDQAVASSTSSTVLQNVRTIGRSRPG